MKTIKRDHPPKSRGGHTSWARNVVPVDPHKVAGMLAEIDLDLGSVVAFLTAPRPTVRTNDFEEFARIIVFGKSKEGKAS